ncbi:hypothetical protein PPL_10390 [Heterostelium album PN500]|uniref:Uncharacterized protein n=1 Tax=Heterostelium pallidum (strain ATCC 26659 / Pp 5 / PN500) TaxID=670386 RepID=D3BQY7_HETP5|nr:hypothetical protein PPL_10390 [Heterostelium album PN500]EFA76173.1 hypothetical protein PPL_10390 [Heterostelium album PN500]|eukprot:XP_020428306.1 hypothetical protein PPL_10390 [Heterostelium album PN500]
MLTRSTVVLGHTLILRVWNDSTIVWLLIFALGDHWFIIDTLVEFIVDLIVVGVEQIKRFTFAFVGGFILVVEAETNCILGVVLTDCDRTDCVLIECIDQQTLIDIVVVTIVDLRSTAFAIGVVTDVDCFVTAGLDKVDIDIRFKSLLIRASSIFNHCYKRSKEKCELFNIDIYSFNV